MSGIITTTAQLADRRLRRIAKLVLPASIRDRLKALHREMVFRRSMRKFLAAPADALAPDNKLLADLVYGWGNEGWSAMGEYLRACIEFALTVEGPVLECGSGLSTLLVGAAAGKVGQTHLSLEHDAKWAEKVRKYLKLYGLDSVKLCCKPLKDMSEYCWYDVESNSIPGGFAMVICDGPPGSTKGGRYGLIPVLKEKLGPRCAIFLDDAGRVQEQKIAARWLAELKATSFIQGTAKPYMRITLQP